jgi:predicted SAM-dependent methyltransferase
MPNAWIKKCGPRSAAWRFFNDGIVRRGMTHLLRNRRLFAGQPDDGAYLNVGSGQNLAAGYCNLDYRWWPGVDICWDIRRGLPIRDDSIAAIFTEHCIEHIELASFLRVAREFHRVLKPRGLVRIVVPDGELYFHNYRTGAPMPYGNQDAIDGLYTPMMSINRIFRGFGHLFIYDFETLKAVLERVGFGEIERRSFGVTADPRLCIDSPSRAVESLYLEARK